MHWLDWILQGFFSTPSSNVFDCSKFFGGLWVGAVTIGAPSWRPTNYACFNSLCAGLVSFPDMLWCRLMPQGKGPWNALDWNWRDSSPSSNCLLVTYFWGSVGLVTGGCQTHSSFLARQSVHVLNLILCPLVHWYGLDLPGILCHVWISLAAESVFWVWAVAPSWHARIPGAQGSCHAVSLDRVHIFSQTHFMLRHAKIKKSTFVTKKLKQFHSFLRGKCCWLL